MPAADPAANSAAHSAASAAIAPIRAVAIDLDGTLLDTAGEMAVAINAMLARLSSPQPTALDPAPQPVTLKVGTLSESAVRNMIGKGIVHLVGRALLAAAGKPPSAALNARALHIYRQCYFEVLGTTAVPYPGVIAGLDRMRALGLPLACITNKAGQFTDALLERMHLRERFAHVVAGDTYEQRKPHPLPLLRTAERFGCAPHELLMIGDSLNDVLAARAAGCPVLCVPYGYNEGAPVDGLDFDGMITDLRQACDWIEQRSQRTASRDPT